MVLLVDLELSLLFPNPLDPSLLSLVPESSRLSSPFLLLIKMCSWASHPNTSSSNPTYPLPFLSSSNYSKGHLHSFSYLTISLQPTAIWLLSHKSLYLPGGGKLLMPTEQCPAHHSPKGARHRLGLRMW